MKCTHVNVCIQSIKIHKQFDFFVCFGYWICRHRNAAWNKWEKEQSHVFLQSTSNKMTNRNIYCYRILQLAAVNINRMAKTKLLNRYEWFDEWSICDNECAIDAKWFFGILNANERKMVVVVAVICGTMLNDNDEKRLAVRVISVFIGGGKIDEISIKCGTARTIRWIYEQNVWEKCLRSKNQKLSNVRKMAVDKFLQENNYVTRIIFP